MALLSCLVDFLSSNTYNLKAVFNHGLTIVKFNKNLIFVYFLHFQKVFPHCIAMNTVFFCNLRYTFPLGQQ